MSPELDLTVIRALKLAAQTVFQVAEAKLGKARADILRKAWANSNPKNAPVPESPIDLD